MYIMFHMIYTYIVNTSLFIQEYDHDSLCETDYSHFIQNTFSSFIYIQSFIKLILFENVLVVV